MHEGKPGAGPAFLSDAGPRACHARSLRSLEKARAFGMTLGNLTAYDGPQLFFLYSSNFSRNRSRSVLCM